MSALPNFDGPEPPIDPDLEPIHKIYPPIKQFLDYPPMGIYQRETELGKCRLTTIFQIPEITEMQVLAILNEGFEGKYRTAELENIRVFPIIRSKWRKNLYKSPLDDKGGININIAFAYPDDSIVVFESGGVLTNMENIWKLLAIPKSGRIPDDYTIFMNTRNFSELVSKAIREENIAPCPLDVLDKLLAAI